MFAPLSLRGGAFFGVDHSLAGFPQKRNKEARDEDLLTNLKVRNRTFAQIAAYGNSVAEPPLKLKVMVADVSQKIQAVLNAVNDAQSIVTSDQLLFAPNRLNLSKISETWNELVRAVNPYLTGPNLSLLSDGDTNQLKQMISSQLLAPLNKLAADIKLKADAKKVNVNQVVVNNDILYGDGSISIINQIEDAWYLPVRYGAQSVGIDMSIKSAPPSLDTTGVSSPGSEATDVPGSAATDVPQTPAGSVPQTPASAIAPLNIQATPQSIRSNLSNLIPQDSPIENSGSKIPTQELISAASVEWNKYKTNVQERIQRLFDSTNNKQIEEALNVLFQQINSFETWLATTLRKINSTGGLEKFIGNYGMAWAMFLFNMEQAIFTLSEEIRIQTGKPIPYQKSPMSSAPITAIISPALARNLSPEVLNRSRQGQIPQTPTQLFPQQQAPPSQQQAPPSQQQGQPSPPGGAVRGPLTPNTQMAQAQQQVQGQRYNFTEGKITNGNELVGKTAVEIEGILNNPAQSGMTFTEIKSVIRTMNESLPQDQKSQLGSSKGQSIKNLAELIAARGNQTTAWIGSGRSGAGQSGGRQRKFAGKTDYSGPMETIMEEPKTPRPRSVGSARPRPRKLPKESYEGFDDMANEGFGMYGRAGPMQPKTELMMTENMHMPILSGNKGLPKIYGMEKKLAKAGFYKPKF